jgi:hypothetical protein
MGFQTLTRSADGNIYIPSGKITQAVKQLNQAVAEAQTAVDWHTQFVTVGQLETGGVKMLVEGFLPEGINMLGALAGNCKTLFALSLAKALTTGQPFLGRFAIKAPTPVLYLIPESNGAAFRQRAEKFGIPNSPELFLCRTVSQGGTLLMDDPSIKAAVGHMKPLVILDTAIRFNKSDDENSASMNKMFVDDAIGLIAGGARGIFGLHHATKNSRKEGLTLENALRGTGDLAAMCDSVYGLRRNDVLYDNGNGPLELQVICLKPRDFEPPLPFVIAATTKFEDGKIISHIDSNGDFVTLDPADLIQDLDSRFVKAVMDEPTLTMQELADILGQNIPKVQRIAKRAGFRKVKGGNWIMSKAPLLEFSQKAIEVAI